MSVKLDSIILFVRNVAQLKAFYADVFSFEVLEETENEWVVLNSGACKICIHKIGDQYLSGEGLKPENNTKIVFETNNIEDLREKLMLKSIEIGQVKTFENYNYWICNGKDPEGNIFQLKQKK